MAVQFLLDEHVEHEVMHRLEKLGYDVEHVESNPELGKGTGDTPIAEFSLRHELVIVTHDSDFVIDHSESDYYGTVYFEEEPLSAKQMADVLHAMARQYPESQFEGLAFGSTNWL